MAKAIHSMVRVLDEQRSVDFYQQAFGLSIAERLDFDTFTLVYLSNEENSFELELTINKDNKEAYDLGNGYGHLALCVEDLDSEHERFKTLGFAPRDIVEFNRDGALFAKFFFVNDPDGYAIEVLQHHGRFK
ncbi:VOC family protein [Granulosicoccus antarcticus]|uniref:Lactoylglutathione lyase n=1 Tax=Granulosicoccus antarcticus IMCC3135 TaxID=1192854 RepID=A0A2Z2NQD9_9GAMM|nr:VOC family protein [Granulosicoccus antarcticus]ASJ71020.1 Lactoylglutathione lyase [Granulosicoccus antarcticus IMCC3135]